MNPQWETFWKQDLERRAEEALAPIERNRCLMDVYQAKVDAYIAIAERAGFNKDHPLVQEMAKQLPDMPAMKLPEFDFATINIPSIDIPPPSIPVLDIPDIQLQKP
jgi:hypothetical protein